MPIANAKWSALRTFSGAFSSDRRRRMTVEKNTTTYYYLDPPACRIGPFHSLPHPYGAMGGIITRFFCRNFRALVTVKSQYGAKGTLEEDFFPVLH